MDWIEIELLGYGHYARKGYSILTKLVKNNSYDFVAEKNGEFIRVNVKCAGKKDHKLKNSWSISLSGASKGKNELATVDIYLVWLPHQNRFIELPGNFFSGFKSSAVLIPKQLINEEP